jgi:hypothetical protein
LGIVADKIGAKEFLPTSTSPARSRSSTLGGLGSVLISVRAAFLAVLSAAIGEALWDASQSQVAEAVAGIAGAIAVVAAVRVLAMRVPGARGAEGAGLLGLAICLGGVFWIQHSAGAPEHALAAAWALTTSLALALPVAPMPGAGIARAAGRLSARRPSDRLAAVLIAALGIATALLLFRGMKLLPIALVASGAEGAEAYLAALRDEHLSRAPRFARWPPEAVAELRAMLRASYTDDVGTQELDLDREALRRVESLRRVRSAPAWAIALVVGLAIAGAWTGRAALHHVETAGVSDAIRVLLR